MLQEEFKASNSIFFWKVRGLVDPTEDLYLKDGVHLNDNSNIKYTYKKINKINNIA